MFVALSCCACASAPKKPYVMPIKADASAAAVFAEKSASKTFLVKNSKTIKNGKNMGIPSVSVMMSSAVSMADTFEYRTNNTLRIYISDKGEQYLLMSIYFTNGSQAPITFDVEKDINVYAINSDGTETLLKTYNPSSIAQLMAPASVPLVVLREQEAQKAASSLLKSPLTTAPGATAEGFVFIDRKIAPDYKIIVFKGEDVYEFFFTAK